jgi:hypothetical protein
MTTGHRFPAGVYIAAEGLIQKSEVGKTGAASTTSGPDEAQVSICRRWIEEFCVPAKTVKEYKGSYGLKHDVERWANEYVSNGAFIQAAHDLGFTIKRISQDSYNAYFNLVSPEFAWQEVKPKMFSRWLFAQHKSDCPTGDLARDAIEDRSWPRETDMFIGFWDYLCSCGVDAVVLRTLVDAWEKYKGEPAPAPTDEILDDCQALYDRECDEIEFGDSYSRAPRNERMIYALFSLEVPLDMRAEGFAHIKDPVVKYVGQTTDPAHRLKQHVLSPGSMEKTKWIGDVLTRGTGPYMAIVAYVPAKIASMKERAYVYAFDDLERFADVCRRGCYEDKLPRGAVLLNRQFFPKKGGEP